MFNMWYTYKPIFKGWPIWCALQWRFEHTRTKMYFRRRHVKDTFFFWIYSWAFLRICLGTLLSTIIGLFHFFIFYMWWRVITCCLCRRQHRVLALIWQRMCQNVKSVKMRCHQWQYMLIEPFSVFWEISAFD